MSHTLLDPNSYTLTAYSWPPLIMGGLVALLGVVVFFRERDSGVSTTFCLLTWATATWLLCIGAIFSVKDPGLAKTWAKLAQTGVIFIPPLVYAFTLSIVKTLSIQSKWLVGSFLLSALFFAAMIETSWFIRGVYQYPWGFYPQYGPLSIPFLGFFAIALSGSWTLLWKQYREASPSRYKERLKFFMLALGMGYLGSIDYLPAFGIRVYPAGYVPVLGFLITSAYVIWRYHLIDITPAFIATKIFNTMARATLVLDAEFRVSLVNQLACQIFQWQEEDLIGTKAEAALPNFFTPQLRETLLTQGVVEDYETTYQVQDSQKWLRLSASVIKDERQSPVAYVCLISDVTDRRRQEDDIRLYSQIVKNMPIGLSVWRQDDLHDARSWRLIALNPSIAQMIGVDPTPYIGQKVLDIFPRLAATGLLDTLATVLHSGKPMNLQEFPYNDVRFPDSFFDLQIFALPDQCVGIAVENVTSGKRAEESRRESENRFQLLIEAIKDYSIIILDPDGYVASWNKGAERIKGYRTEEIIGKHFSLFYPLEDVRRGKPEAMLKKALEEGQARDTGWRIRKDGTRFWAEVLFTPIWDASGRLRGFAKITRDISEQVQLRDLSLRDELTKLYNRRGFLTLAQQEFFKAARTHKTLKVLLVDLDGLKLVNDTYGHLAGDAAIKQTADVLRKTFRHSDILARIGGDEFAIVAIEEEEDPQVVFRRLDENLKHANETSGAKPPLSFSYGAIQVQGGDKTQVEDVLAEADKILYEQKRLKKSRQP